MLLHVMSKASDKKTSISLPAMGDTRPWCLLAWVDRRIQLWHTMLLASVGCALTASSDRLTSAATAASSPILSMRVRATVATDRQEATVVPQAPVEL